MHPPIRGGFPARATAERGGPSSVKNTNPCAPPGFPLRSLDELLQAPARRNQPTLHPEKKDGALWISIDNEVKYDIKRAFSNDFDGAWWNLSEVPQDQQDKWWSDFVQKYYWDSEHHNLVKTLWTKKLRRMISNNISKGKTHNKKPTFVSDNNWKLMWRYWNTPQAVVQLPAEKASLCEQEKLCASPLLSQLVIVKLQVSAKGCVQLLEEKAPQCE
ncbi:unnamed protein product [Eruca vesicaria subsp. sativa]|uniref:Uncharacterized protein n=1 Tax=Eruca vesicaria subsp. sativa TaxID=29727 RepID=A0ABC8JUP6_ERUVS|nr:unnamed protein product [Eruca vesicaria subsp. sativa]